MKNLNWGRFMRSAGAIALLIVASLTAAAGATTAEGVPGWVDTDPEAEHWLDATAKARGWVKINDPAGRWFLFTSVKPKEAQEAVDLMREFGTRLDQLLGPENPEGLADPVPLTLAFVKSQDDVRALCDTIGEQWNHLGPWSSVARDFPRVHHWNPLLSVVKHSPDDKVLKPEVQLAHEMVQLEIVRRYGRMPYWVGEALSYALQDEIIGGIYGYSYRQSAEFSDEYHFGWRFGAKQALENGTPTPAALIKGSGNSFDQGVAYQRFALALWMVARAPEDIPRMFESFAEKRGKNWQPESDYEPSAEITEEVLTDVFRQDMWGKLNSYWVGVKDGGGPGAVELAVLEGAASVADDFKFSLKKERYGRLKLYSDFKGSQLKRAYDNSLKVLKRLDKVLGKAEDLPVEGVTAYLIKERDAYRSLCNTLGEADPALAGAMKAFKAGTGFTIYRPQMTVYFHDTRVQEEATPDANIAHSVAHLELNRRYGMVPLWLAEGMAVALEEELFGVVWANWNLSGFVYTASRGEWRNFTKRMISTEAETVLVYDWDLVPNGGEPPQVRKRKPTLMDLYSYTARPFLDDLGHMAYGFAIYGMEGDPEGLQKLFKLLKAEYAKQWATGGVFQPEPERMAELVTEAFGADFEEKFKAFWADPPKRPK